MKKILLFCAALVAAVNMNATITEMTCAEAKAAALALNSGETGTDSVSVTGYVTYTNGTVSPSRDGNNIPQQVFWMDDQKGTTQTIQAYWCNLPSEEALNVGDKVTIKGFLLNYNGNTAEMKNGDVEIIERVVVKHDTINVTVCEAIQLGEALSDKEITNDFFTLQGVVSSVKTEMNQYKQESFWMVCDEDEKELQAYNIIMEDSVAAQVGDSVALFGKIQKYGTTIEIISGTAKVTAKGGVTINTYKVSVAEAVAAGMQLEKGKTSVDIYIVEGYADSIAYAFSEQYKNMSFYMCDDMTNPTYNFEAYKVSTESAVEVGNKVYVVGNLQHYYKAADGDKPEIDLIEISGGKVYFSDPSGVDNIYMTPVKAVKVIENGQVFIEKDGVRYTILGAQTK